MNEILNHRAWMKRLTPEQQDVIKNRGSFTTTIFATDKPVTFFCHGCKMWHRAEQQVQLRVTKGKTTIEILGQKDDEEWGPLFSFPSTFEPPEKTEKFVQDAVDSASLKYALYVSASNLDPCNLYEGTPEEVREQAAEDIRRLAEHRGEPA